MSLQTLTLLVVGGSFLLYISIAFLSSARSTGEFYVAGKHVHPVANGMATAADWMSAASFISMAGLIAFLGYDGSVYLMGWTGGYVLLALLIAPYLRRMGTYTVPEFIGDRYMSQAARAAAVLCLIVVSFTYVAGQMRGVGIVFARFLGVEFYIGLIVGMGVVFFYAVLGGMRGITYTQVAQYCVLIFAYTLPAIFISIQVTGVALPQLGFGSEISGGGYLLDKVDGLITELGFAEYTSGTKSRIDVFFITAALMVGTAGLPHVIVRFFTVPKVSDARVSAGWALVFIAILYTTAPAVAAMARWNLTNTIQMAEPGTPEGNLLYEERPEWFKTWEETQLLVFTDKNGDGRVQYYNDENKDFETEASKWGWNGNELEVDRDIIVLANPEIANLPNWVIAFVAAGGIAAALSTAAGLLLVISASVSHDLMKGIFWKGISEKQELIAVRLSAIVAILLAGYLGFDPPGFVAQVVALAFGLAAATLFPAILMGIFSIRINALGVVSGMLSGLVFTVGYIVYFNGVFIEPIGDSSEWLFGISPEGIGIIGMLLNFAIAFAVSYGTKPLPDDALQIVKRLRGL